MEEVVTQPGRRAHPLVTLAGRAYAGNLRAVSGIANAFAGVALTFIMFLTTLDVILRLLGRPIVGTYELVAFSGGVIIGFALPMTSLQRAHVFVDFLLVKMAPSRRALIHLFTRCLGIGFFAVASFNIMKFGLYLYRTNEVSPTLQLPFYPVAFGLGCCFFIECLVLVGDMVKIIGGTYD